jgi:hypothetical protein
MKLRQRMEALVPGRAPAPPPGFSQEKALRDEESKDD